jgi:Flp pilus assembly CpaE family ATPase
VLINGVSPHHQPALIETQHTLWEFTGVTDTTVLVVDDDVVQRATANKCTVAEIGPKNNLARALAPLITELFPALKPVTARTKKPAARLSAMASLFGRVPGKQAKGLL